MKATPTSEAQLNAAACASTATAAPYLSSQRHDTLHPPTAPHPPPPLLPSTTFTSSSAFSARHTTNTDVISLTNSLHRLGCALRGHPSTLSLSPHPASQTKPSPRVPDKTLTPISHQVKPPLLALGPSPAAASLLLLCRCRQLLLLGTPLGLLCQSLQGPLCMESQCSSTVGQACGRGCCCRCCPPGLALCGCVPDGLALEAQGQVGLRV